MSGRRRIIEITGVPGVGKTKLTEAIAERAGSDWCVYSDRIILAKLKFSSSYSLVNRVASDLLLTLYAAIMGADSIRVLGCVIGQLQRLNIPPLLKLRILGNVVRKIGRVNYINLHLGHLNVVVDEGIGHIPFNLQSYEGGMVNDCVGLVYKASQRLLSPNILVVLDAENVDEYARINSRGHARISGKSSQWVEGFCLTNRALVESIKREAHKYFWDVYVIRASSESATEEMISVLEGKR